MEKEIDSYNIFLSKLNQTQIYREALRVQMEITWPCMVEYFENSKPWLSAKTVSDLGCGPGDMIFKLSKAFSDKTYSGFDMNPEFIEIAKTLAKEQSFKADFDTLDLISSPWPKSDFKILRAVLQHIRDLEVFIDMMDRSVSKDNFILIYDAADDQAACMTVPPIIQWERLMEGLAEKQKQSGGNRNAISDFLEKLPAHWKILDDKVVKPQIRQEDHFSFAQYALSVGNLLPGFFGMEVDIEQLKNQVIAWLENSDSKAWFKTRFVLLKKT